MDFIKYPKTARWGSPFDITEKLDGTNAAVLIRPVDLSTDEYMFPVNEWLIWSKGKMYAVAAQSRTRIITPEDDNYGFAQWVEDNIDTLVADLGPGTHYGEWWGAKIQRAYGLTNGQRYFSLFDVNRYDNIRVEGALTDGLDIVPIVIEGEVFDSKALLEAESVLRTYGSLAAIRFDRPEGFVVHWHHNGMRLKYILDK